MAICLLMGLVWESNSTPSDDSSDDVLGTEVAFGGYFGYSNYSVVLWCSVDSIGSSGT